jgi:hypothetical protein
MLMSRVVVEDTAPVDVQSSNQGHAYPLPSFHLYLSSHLSVPILRYLGILSQLELLPN